MGFYLLIVDTPPSASNKANQRSGHVLACINLACKGSGRVCSVEVIQACTDSAFNIYHDPAWTGDTPVSALPSAIQEPVK